MEGEKGAHGGRKGGSWWEKGGLPVGGKGAGAAGRRIRANAPCGRKRGLPVGGKGAGATDGRNSVPSGAFWPFFAPNGRKNPPSGALGHPERPHPAETVRGRDRKAPSTAPPCRNGERVGPLGSKLLCQVVHPLDHQHTFRPNSFPDGPTVGPPAHF